MVEWETQMPVVGVDRVEAVHVSYLFEDCDDSTATTATSHSIQLALLLPCLTLSLVFKVESTCSLNTELLRQQTTDMCPFWALFI